MAARRQGQSQVLCLGAGKFVNRVQNNRTILVGDQLLQGVMVCLHPVGHSRLLRF